MSYKFITEKLGLLDNHWSYNLGLPLVSSQVTGININLFMYRCIFCNISIHILYLT